MGSALPPVITAVIAGVVSLVVAVLTTRAAGRSTTRQLQQAQFKEIIAKRIEMYPKLWRITINFETNWSMERRPKTREWAEEYVAAINEVNLDAGLFFSQDLYLKFADLRRALYQAIDHTEPSELVFDVEAIRQAVYGPGGEPGLATHLKDDLGSYQPALLQLRDDPLLARQAGSRRRWWGAGLFASWVMRKRR